MKRAKFVSNGFVRSRSISSVGVLRCAQLLAVVLVLGIQVVFAQTEAKVKQIRAESDEASKLLILLVEPRRIEHLMTASLFCTT